MHRQGGAVAQGLLAAMRRVVLTLHALAVDQVPPGGAAELAPLTAGFSAALRQVAVALRLGASGAGAPEAGAPALSLPPPRALHTAPRAALPGRADPVGGPTDGAMAGSASGPPVGLVGGPAAGPEAGPVVALVDECDDLVAAIDAIGHLLEPQTRAGAR